MNVWESYRKGLCNGRKGVMVDEQILLKILRVPCGLPQGKRLVRIVPLYFTLHLEPRPPVLAHVWCVLAHRHVLAHPLGVLAQGVLAQFDLCWHTLCWHRVQCASTGCASTGLSVPAQGCAGTPVGVLAQGVLAHSRVCWHTQGCAST